MSPIAHKRRRRPGRGLHAQYRDSGLRRHFAACAGYSYLPSDAGGRAADGAETFTGHVTRVVDGDTFAISSANERIRFWVSTPPNSTSRAVRRQRPHSPP